MSLLRTCANSICMAGKLRHLGKNMSLYPIACKVKVPDEMVSTPKIQFDAIMQDKAKLVDSVNLISKCLRIFKSNELAICFNGGKDCTILVDMFHKLQLKYGYPVMQTMYFRTGDAFEEVESFIKKSTINYRMKLNYYSGSQKEGLQRAIKEMPQLRAVFMGCRRSDPNCECYTPLLPTDDDWPALIRIFPILDWSYDNVWDYLRQNDIPYCKLYDQGYTSLGDKSQTEVNPNLGVYNEKQQKYDYRPAYELNNSNLERVNRDKDSSQNESMIQSNNSLVDGGQ